MFNIIKISDAEYELKASSGGLVGRFLLQVDGFYYFELAERRRSGVLSDHVLIEIGTKLKELNQPMYDHLDKHFKNGKWKIITSMLKFLGVNQKLTRF